MPVDGGRERPNRRARRRKWDGSLQPMSSHSLLSRENITVGRVVGGAIVVDEDGMCFFLSRLCIFFFDFSFFGGSVWVELIVEDDCKLLKDSTEGAA